MCEALDIIEARGIKKGEERGKKLGEKIGEKRGEKRGIINTLSSLVREGILSVSDAAKRANMSVPAFKSEAGIK